MDIDMTRTIDAEISRVFCPWHGEPLRSQWPKGYLIASTQLLQHVINNAADMAACTTPEESKKTIGQLLDVKPACCRVDKYFMLRVYMECGIKRLGACDVCGKFKSGTPIKTKQRDFDHVCFECHLTNFKVLQ